MNNRSILNRKVQASVLSRILVLGDSVTRQVDGELERVDGDFILTYIGI